jgi:hypothetical protein
MPLQTVVFFVHLFSFLFWKVFFPKQPRLVFFLICRFKYAMNSSVSLLWIELFRTSIVELPVDFLFTVLFQISLAKFSSSVDFVFQ